MWLMSFKFTWALIGSVVVTFGLLSLLVSFIWFSTKSCMILFFPLSSTGINFCFLLDGVSWGFCGVVSLITGSVLIYSLSYMEGEVFFNRFMVLVSGFVGSMLFLVFSNNMLQFILGWDGLGITSYFLVIFYNTHNSSNAGMITLMINRIGDVGVILLIMLFSWYNWSFHWVNGMSNYEWFGCMVVLLGTASTKSAQLPFSAWLPAAMAAPTPVSSLVHSSTLVTAGVYMLYRLSFYFSESFKVYLFLLGGLTSLMGGWGAMFESDMKKLVALSTLSHLGLMVLLMSYSSSLSFMHLCYHAFFKALLFMCVGLWIHGVGDYQDTMKVSNLFSISKVNSGFAVVGGMSLCGLPFLTGFYSKDFFLEVLLYESSGVFSSLLYFLTLLTSFLYSLRFLWLILGCSGKLLSLFSWSEDNRFTYHLSMVLLLVMSICYGSISSDYMNGVGGSLYFSLLMKLCFLSLMVGGVMIMWKGVHWMMVSRSYSYFYASLGFIYQMSRSVPVLVSKILGMVYMMNDKSFLNIYSGGYLNEFTMSKWRGMEGKISLKFLGGVWVISMFFLLAN
nr:NADH dehydrogenase subunit 5 [Pennella sp. (in: crustaceans)]